TTPPEPNVGSRLPSASYRASVITETAVPLLEPAAMILPSGWSASAKARLEWSMRVLTTPFDPKLESGAPSGWKRSSVKVSSDGLPGSGLLPATMILPSGWTVIAFGSPWGPVATPPDPKDESSAPLAV